MKVLKPNIDLQKVMKTVVIDGRAAIRIPNECFEDVEQKPIKIGKVTPTPMDCPVSKIFEVNSLDGLEDFDGMMDDPYKLNKEPWLWLKYKFGRIPMRRKPMPQMELELSNKIAHNMAEAIDDILINDLTKVKQDEKQTKN